METWKNPNDSCSDCSCQMGMSLCTLHDPHCNASVPTPRTSTTPELPVPCGWSQWMNVDTPNTGSGDVESLVALRTAYRLCENPVNIECRKVSSLEAVTSGSGVTCDLQTGLTCTNAGQAVTCADYEVRVYCPCAGQCDVIFIFMLVCTMIFDCVIS